MRTTTSLFCAQGSRVFVHFDGWNKKFDEWILMKENRLRAHPANAAPVAETNSAKRRRASAGGLLPAAAVALVPGKRKSLNKELNQLEFDHPGTPHHLSPQYLDFAS